MKRACSVAVAAALALVAFAACSSAQNLVANGDFEGSWVPLASGCDPVPNASCCAADSWTAWSAPLPPSSASPNPAHPAFIEMPGGNCAPDAGNNYQRIEGGFRYDGAEPQRATSRGGLVQAVDTTPGASYDLDLQLRFQWIQDFVWILWPSEAWFGYDLTGQTSDPMAETIVWTPPFLENRSLPDPEPPDPPNAVQHDGVWNQYSRRITATGTKTSIWVRQVVYDEGRGILDVDNVSLKPGEGQLMAITSGPTATVISNTSFRIDWTTDAAGTSTVEYGTAAPADAGLVYASSASSAGTTTNHSVTLTGLAKETTYHFRAISSASGYKTVYSFDHKFKTPTPARATFKNGGFEEVDDLGNPTLAPWKTFGDTDGIQQAGWYMGFGPNEGTRYLGSAASYGVKNGGVYQRVQALPGGLYHASFDYKTACYENYTNNNPPPIGVAQYDESQAWLGIDPFGGTDPESPLIVWTKHYTTDWAIYPPSMPPPVGWAPTPPQWSPPHLPLGSLDVTAQSGTITIFVKLWNMYAHIWNVEAADNVQLTGPAPPAKQVASAGAARSDDNDGMIEITTPLVVSLVPQSETGFFYAQDEDGTAGLRVESDTVPTVGDRVLVRGELTRNANGERLVTDATVTVTTTGGAGPAPRMIVNKAVGGKGYTETTGPALYGLTDQGLLHTVTGRVTRYALDDLGEPVVWVDDGSAVSAGGEDIGIKVIKTTLYLTEDAIGRDYYKITGVVTSEVVDGKQIRVLRGRGYMFPEDVVQVYP